MATLNKKNTRTKKPDAVNRSGHLAYSMEEKPKLVTQVLTTFFNEPKFYGDTSRELIETAERVATNPEGCYFVAQLALYARDKMNMRTVSHVLAVVVCRANATHKQETARAMVKRLVVRGDDVTNMLATYYGLYGVREPNSLRRGLRDALEAIHPSAIAKYQEKGKAVSMADAIKICHPNPNSDKSAQTFKACLEGTLKVPRNWKAAVSEDADGNKASWNELVAAGDLPYMAALRNLRNILDDDTVTGDTVKAIMERLSDPAQVKRSRQLPFRYLSAYEAVMSSPRCSTAITDALEAAFDVSVEALPRLKGRTIVCIDVSGSMDFRVARQSTVKCSEIAKQLGYVVGAMSEDAVIYTFDTKIQREDFSRRAGILAQVRALKNRGGGGTSMELPFNEAIAKKIDCDRFVVLSDNEVNGYYSSPIQTLADQYRGKTGKNVWVHAVDLQGYGTQQFKGARTNVLTGWSEKMLEFIPMVENAEGGMIDEIEKIKI